MEKNNNQADLPCNMALMTHSQPQQCPDNNCPWRARYEELSKSNGTYLDEIQAKTEDVFNQAEAKVFTHVFNNFVDQELLYPRCKCSKWHANSFVDCVLISEC